MKGLYLFGLLFIFSNCSTEKITETILPSESSIEQTSQIKENTFTEVEIEENSSLKQMSALDLLTKIRSEHQKFDFYASFTEPFRTIYFIDDIALFDSANDGPEIYILSHRFDDSTDVQTISLINPEKEWVVLIEKGAGSDGMSEIKFPYKVKLNDTFFGGGGVEFQKEE